MIEHERINAEILNKFEFFTYNNKTYFLDEVDNVCRLIDLAHYGCQIKLAYDFVNVKEFEDELHNVIENCKDTLDIINLIKGID